MAIDYEKEFPSKYVFLPKIGESAEYDIIELRKVPSQNKKLTFKERKRIQIEDPETGENIDVDKEVDLGYFIQAKLKNGKLLTVTNLSAFTKIFCRNQILDGEKIKIYHVDKGEWKVERLVV